MKLSFTFLCSASCATNAWSLSWIVFVNPAFASPACERSTSDRRFHIGRTGGMSSAPYSLMLRSMTPRTSTGSTTVTFPSACTSAWLTRDMGTPRLIMPETRGSRTSKAVSVVASVECSNSSPAECVPDSADASARRCALSRSIFPPPIEPSIRRRLRPRASTASCSFVMAPMMLFRASASASSRAVTEAVTLLISTRSTSSSANISAARSFIDTRIAAAAVATASTVWPSPAWSPS